MSKEKELMFFFRNKEDEKHLLDFKSKYAIKKVMFGAVYEKVYDKFKDGKKVCRFCGKNSDEVTFKQKTHIIPQLINRSLPVSNFECDECNPKFSKYENDFSSYYLLHRAIFGHKRKKPGLVKLKTKVGVEIQGVDKTKENLKELNISDSEIDEILNSNRSIVKLLADPTDEGVKIEDDGEKLTLTTERQKYKPINVHRTLLKIALSLIPQDEYGNYKSMLNILNKDFDGLEKDLFSITERSLPKYNSYFKIPTVIHFDRINPEDNHPQKLFVLYMDNKIIQIPVFTDNDFDRIHKDKENYRIWVVPPHINPITLVNEKPDFAFHMDMVRLPFKQIDLSSIELVKGEKDSITITRNKSPELEEKDLRILKGEIIDEPKDSQYWGFGLHPEYFDNHVDIKIIFDFLAPVSKTEHTYLIAGCYYRINNLTKEEFEKNISGIEDLILMSMTHAFKMYRQKFPQFEHVELKPFSKKFFQAEIIRQMDELEKNKDGSI